MPSELFVGPAYTLKERKASMQSAVNMYLSGLETPDKAPFIMESVPGLRLLETFSGPCRGCIEDANGRTFFVFGSALIEVTGETYVQRGTLTTSSGPVDMAYGLFQLVIVDGPYGYVLTLSSNKFQQITAEGFYGSETVEFLSNFFLFIRPDSQQQYIAAVNDATSFDPLDFASAEQAPDNLVGQVVLNSVAWEFGTLSTEFFFRNADGTYPFSPNGQGVMEVGLVAPHSAKKVAESIIWIGRTVEGFGQVYRSNGYGAVRVSTQAIDAEMQKSTDLSKAVAYVYQSGGLTFWCVNAPGLDATWCYELTTGTWHTRCEMGGDGLFKAGRVTHHVFSGQRHLVGDAAGNLYESSSDYYTNAGDPLVRERTSPHSAAPSLLTLFFRKFVLDCSTGGRGQRAAGVGLNNSLDQRRDDYKVQLSWADWRPNRALQFRNAIVRSVGYVGDTFARLLWSANVLGSARDRVWRVRFAEDAPFSIVSATAETEVGTD